MTERIEQQFLIDAAQSLRMLDSLDAAYLKFEGRLLSLAQSATIANAALNKTSMKDLKQELQDVANQLNTVNQGLNKFNKQNLSNPKTQLSGIRQEMSNLSDLTRNAYVSFETLGRVIQTQLIISGINSIRDAISQSVDDAGALQRQYALIATIATEIDTAPSEARRGVDVGQIAAEARELSDSLNIPQLEVAQGLYNAISNQVGTFAESITFASDAGKFAKATNSELADSIDALSAVLKSYNLGVEQTEHVSNILFATIDKGRVTANELGSTLGRILPAASELGVAFEEVGASIANVSVNGLSTDETLTQIRATFSGLLKPSKALKAAYDELGVASGKAGIQQFGFVGLLEQLRKTAGTTSNELAALFPNVRNLGAVLALTGENFDSYQKTLASFQNVDGLAEQAFNTATATDIEKITRASNNFRNEIAELGQELLHVGANAAEFFGLLDDSNADTKAFITTVATLGVTVGATAATMFTLSNGIRAVAAASAFVKANPILGAGGLLLAGGALGATAIRAYETYQLEKFEEQLKRLDDADLSKLNNTLKDTAKESEATFKLLAEGISGGYKSIAGDVTSFNNAYAELTDQNKDYVESVKASLDSFVGVREEFLKGLKKAATDSASFISQSVANVERLKGLSQDSKLENQLNGLEDSERGFALARQATQLASEATTQLERASQLGDAVGLKAARDNFQRAEAALQEAKAIGTREENRELEVSAATKLQQLIKDQITAEEQLQVVQKRRQDSAEAAGRKQEIQLAKLDEQAKRVAKSSELFDKDGNALTGDALTKQIKERDAELAKLQKLGADFGDVGGFSSLRDKAADKLRKVTAEVDVTIVDQGKAISDQVSAALGKFNSQPFVVAIKTALGKALSETIQPEEMQNLVDSFRNRVRDSNDLTAREDRATGQRDIALNTALKQLSILRQVNAPTGADNVIGAFNTGYTDFRKDLDTAALELQGLAEDPNVELDKLRERLQIITQGISESFGQVSSVFQSNYEEEALAFKAAVESLDNYLTETEKLKQVQAEQAVANEQGFDDTKIKQATESIRQFAEVTEEAANEAMRLRVINESYGLTGRPPNYAGQAYFNEGGQARGVDTQLGMFAPGESIINARSSARFFSQIQAINAGQFPVFRANEGSVTNVGDINVTVQGQSSGSSTGRAVAQEIRRELRRGTSKI